jgi:hypothetical protein
METSWELLINKNFEDIRSTLVKYLTTKNYDFRFEWQLWNSHCGNSISRCRRHIIYILGIDESISKFPIKTATLNIILRMIEYSLLSQINFMYKTLTPQQRNNDRLINNNLKIIIKEAMKCSKYNYYLYDLLCLEYKKYWHCAHKIQIQWKKSISDPNYKLCRNRLLCEFKELKTYDC